MLEDELAFVAPWGFDPAEIEPPVLFLHGGRDRIVPARTARGWPARLTPPLWLRPDDGHISVLNSATAALDWLLEHTPDG